MAQVPADKALVILRKGEVRKVALGGTPFVNPLLDTCEYIPLDVQTLDLHIHGVESSEEHKGARYNVKAETMVKVLSVKDILTRNALHLIRMTKQEIVGEGLRVVEDQFRRYASYKTPLEVSEDRAETERWILQWANDVLNPQAIQVRTFVIKEMDDEFGYFERVSLGTLDLWLRATDEHGRIIPELREEYERQVRLRLDG